MRYFKNCLSIKRDVAITKMVLLIFLYLNLLGIPIYAQSEEITSPSTAAKNSYPMIYGNRPTLRSTPANQTVIAIGGGKEHIFYQIQDQRLYGVGYNNLYKLNQNKCCSPAIDWPGARIILP